MKSFKLWKLSVGLIVVGAVVLMLGFLMSGGNWHAYQPYHDRWYSIVHY